MSFTELTREQLETTAEGFKSRSRITQLETSIEGFQNQIEAHEETIKTQGDVIRGHLTEIELVKKELEGLKATLDLPQTGPIGRSHESDFPHLIDIVYHQQNNPSTASPSHLACGKKIDRANVPVFEREKVTCKNCLSKPDPHIRY